MQKEQEIVSVWQGMWQQRNLANALTLTRVLLVLPVFWSAFFQAWDWAVCLIMLAALTDAEGSWARMTKTTTALGWAADPIADKVFTNLVLAGAVFFTGNVWLLLLWSVMFGYDLDNTIRRFDAIRSACLGREPVTSTPITWVSKGKTVLLFLVMIVHYAPNYWGLGVYADLLTQVALGTVAYSWLQNRRTALAFMFKKKGI